eukprot:5672988-Pyramimonas_sp.AAC.1
MRRRGRRRRGRRRRRRKRIAILGGWRRVAFSGSSSPRLCVAGCARGSGCRGRGGGGMMLCMGGSWCRRIRRGRGWRGAAVAAAGGACTSWGRSSWSG